MEELEVRAAARAVARRRRARARRVVLGLVAAVLVAATAGWAVGRRTRPSPQAPSVERMDLETQLQRALSREINRTLLELWRMEDAEALRGRIPR